MSTKGDLTRAQIKQQARRLFAAKGFACVTMQDICEACDLSRGGLYRHYVSTGEIFCAILDDDEAAALESLRQATENHVPASTMFRTFLENRIRAVTDPTISIENAVAEFSAQDSKGHYFLCRRGENSIRILTHMLEQGIADGDFICRVGTPASIAKLVLWMIEGMAQHSLLMPLTDDEIAEQIALIEAMLH